MSDQDRLSILMNDLIMLIEAREIYDDASYKKVHDKIMQEVESLGGF